MITVAGRSYRTRGHPRGGLSILAFACLASACLALAACGPAPAPSPDPAAGPAPEAEPFPDPLGVYRDLGYIIGRQRFAAVGRFVFMPGPGDSTFAVLALSLPNSSLRFRRDPPGFVARYQVDVTVGDSMAPAARLDETQEVRVRTFRETSRRDESVLFQGFLTLAPGSYPARLRVSDIASSTGFTSDVELDVPEFGPGSITAPIVVFRGQTRGSREEPPNLIISPGATVEFGRLEPQVYIEAFPLDSSRPVLEARLDSQVVWTDTLAFEPTDGSLHAALVTIDAGRLQPGALGLQARIAEVASVDSTTLLVALMPEWLPADYEEAMDWLRYAGAPAELDSLHSAPPGEQARLFHAFWKRRDPDPETVENEFFEQYFRRIQDATARFGEEINPGWLTDRGAVYVTLGPPDEVLRDLETRQGPGQSQVWLYHESLGFELRLVFLDASGTGAFSLNVESRRFFAEAVQAIYS